MRPNNGDLVGDLPTSSHRSRCRKLPQPRTPRRHPHSRIPAWMSFRLLVPSLWCPAPAVTHEKHCGSSTSLVALICRLTSLLGVKL